MSPTQVGRFLALGETIVRTAPTSTFFHPTSPLTVALLLLNETGYVFDFHLDALSHLPNLLWSFSATEPPLT